MSRDESVLLLIQDSIDELLLSLDVRQISPSLVWPVLRTLAKSCKRWREPSEISSSHVTDHVTQESSRTKGDHSSHDNVTKDVRPESNGKDDSVSHVTDHMTDHVTPEAIEEFFLQYHREKQHQDELGDLGETDVNAGEEQDIPNGGEEGDDPYNQSKQLSPLSQTVVKVMQRCAHYLSGEPPQLRLTVLETLTHCLVALKHEQVSTNVLASSPGHSQVFDVCCCSAFNVEKLGVA